jgi:hypothetical protein
MACPLAILFIYLNKLLFLYEWKVNTFLCLHIFTANCHLQRPWTRRNNKEKFISTDAIRHKNIPRIQKCGFWTRFLDCNVESVITTGRNVGMTLFVRCHDHLSNYHEHFVAHLSRGRLGRDSTQCCCRLGYPTTTPHDAITQKTSTWIFTVVKTWNFASVT